ncbi:predicted protein [Sclerotinia sclerotiorum 1980 UF-70]|uniref:Uncharacterized protein n=1 Tax=Sclerotinia sclerotiorum (strain ATCC 18683 / 1980 / Ss-1) TaxID=665079 RepID=A7E7E6_SCLS1|nr:predicted protein [Sclerotinia sclerotiorum 1980 UF-70]EDN96298.1 predicted protein [Sclerotinia sclerotiorum 1980 UF-70]
MTVAKRAYRGLGGKIAEESDISLRLATAHRGKGSFSIVDERSEEASTAAAKRSVIN